jgi:hypothetical protein
VVGGELKIAGEKGRFEDENPKSVAEVNVLDFSRLQNPCIIV